MVLGEGAGLVVLEVRAHAVARGADILATVAAALGGGPAPGPRGRVVAGVIRDAMAAALARAGLDAVDYVAAGALGDPRLDAAEAAALGDLIGGGTTPVGALAGVLGASGATSALAVGAALLGMRHGFLPAGVPCEEPAADGIALLAGAPPAGTPATALVNAVSLGGSVTSLVLRAE